jgi:glycosyltransferase involved in cell wall biosynthesis
MPFRQCDDSAQEPALRRQTSSPLNRVSVVIPVYRGEQTLGPLVERIAPFTRPQLSPDANRFEVVEVILVHDGAIDHSDVTMEGLAQRYPFIQLVWLSRNFGQHPAILAGMARTTADWVVTMDEDGQHDPRDICRLLDCAVTDGTQLVYARPINSPSHGWLRNACSNLSKWIFIHALGHTHIGRFSSFRLVQGEIARGLAAYTGPNVFLDAALSWVVARSSECTVTVSPQEARSSGYNFGKLLAHFLRLLLTSGTKPLRLISLMGLAAIAVSLFLTLYAMWDRLTHQTRVPGWTSLIIAISFFSGCTLSALGIIAEYLGAALTMAMGKPPYLVVQRAPRRKAA